MNNPDDAKRLFAEYQRAERRRSIERGDGEPQATGRQDERWLRQTLDAIELPPRKPLDEHMQMLNRTALLIEELAIANTTIHSYERENDDLRGQVAKLSDQRRWAIEVALALGLALIGSLMLGVFA